MDYRILVVEDDRNISDLIRMYLEKEGFEVQTVFDGGSAVETFRSWEPDMVLLDVNLPDMDGFAVCRALREHLDCPVLFLTARVEDADKLSGFACGGDDYVLKPFSIDELGARVAAHLRRETRRARAAVVRMDGGLAINYTDRTVTFEGKPLAFAKKEFDIIELLSQNPGQVFDKERIYERVWGLDGTGDASLVAERVRRIRAGLAAAGAKPYIQTVWGCGYKWVE